MAAPYRNSAGFALIRGHGSEVEILLVHPGGPFWVNKDEHGWSIPKGEFDPDTEEPEAAARREFAEETGQAAPTGPTVALKPFRAGSKKIWAWLVRGDLDPETVVSNTFEMEWPPRSGKQQSFPEVDRAAWFPLDQARSRLHKNHANLVDLVTEALPELDRDHAKSQPLQGSIPEE